MTRGYFVHGKQLCEVSRFITETLTQFEKTVLSFHYLFLCQLSAAFLQFLFQRIALQEALKLCGRQWFREQVI